MADSKMMRLAAGSGKSLPKRFPFTVFSLAALTCPKGRDRLYVYDQKTPGLAYCVTRTDHRAYYYVCKHEGATRRVLLGGNGITIEQARKLAGKKTGERAEGKDPSADRRSLRESATLRELWEKYRDQHLMTKCTHATQVTDKSRYKTCLSQWSSRRVLTIKESHVSDLHASIAKERGKITANRAVQLLRRMFAYGRLEHNPASNAVAMFREESRTRFVQPQELPRLFAALDDPKTDSTMRDVFYAALYTGARRSNVLAMRVAEIDADACVWTIPALKSKSGEPVTLPLSPAAMKIIKPRMGHDSGWIFPSFGKTGHLVEVKGAWSDVRERAGLTDVRFHDLRRTMGSWQAGMGASLSIIGKSLGHSSTDATAVYSRLHLAPVRASVEAATAAIMAAAKKKPKAVKKKQRKVK